MSIPREGDEVGLTEASLGSTLIMDIAVFHRTGVDGACHVEKGIEYVVVDNPQKNEVVGACLTVDQEESLTDSLVGVMYLLNLPVANPESHPQVYEIQEVNVQ